MDRGGCVDVYGWAGGGAAVFMPQPLGWGIAAAPSDAGGARPPTVNQPKTHPTDSRKKTFRQTTVNQTATTSAPAPTPPSAQASAPAPAPQPADDLAPLL